MRLPGYNAFRQFARPVVEHVATTGTLRVEIPGKKHKRGKLIYFNGGMSWLLGEHITIYGMTGSGKTHLVKDLIAIARRYNPEVNVYILDTKRDDDDFPGWTGKIKSISAPLPLTPNSGKMQIWQPQGTMAQTRVEVDKWCDSILAKRAKSIVVINDLKDISPKPDAVPDGVPRLLRDGRSFGISVIANTQEAAYVPRQIHNQITYAIRMLMNDSYDVLKVHVLQGGKRPVGTHAEDIPQPPKWGMFISRLDVAPRVIRYYANSSSLIA